jgi:hypothetical protein
MIRLSQFIQVDMKFSWPAKLIKPTLIKRIKIYIVWIKIINLNWIKSLRAEQSRIWQMCLYISLIVQ